MVRKQKQQQTLGVILASTGALLWGVSGPISQFLFQHRQVSPEWLTGLKMLISGCLILLWVRRQQGRHVFDLWHHRRDAILMVIFSIVGMGAVQYIFFLTVRVASAPTATIMQTLGTVMIVLWGIFYHHDFPRPADVLAVSLALFGTWMLVTKGHLLHLAISPLALTFGLLLGLAGAVNTLLPASLLQRYDTLTVVGWSMLLGGLLFSVIHPFWVNVPQLSGLEWLGVGFIVIFGTGLAYMTFLGSLNFISPTAAGLLDAFEPLSATLLSVIFLKMSFNGAQIIGGALILSTVFILSLAKPKDPLTEDLDDTGN
ncbi:DMT family transporter [Furfurilactobacillus curtus]|uniref:Peptide ABC transporter permease n=1 Tax=Furfurilactobacillus curtus TaxID=1746200 RepID=A0ABQ5JKU4_9LACO